MLFYTFARCFFLGGGEGVPPFFYIVVGFALLSMELLCYTSKIERKIIMLGFSPLRFALPSTCHRYMCGEHEAPRCMSPLSRDQPFFRPGRGGAAAPVFESRWLPFWRRYFQGETINYRFRFFWSLATIEPVRISVVFFMTIDRDAPSPPPPPTRPLCNTEGHIQGQQGQQQ